MVNSTRNEQEWSRNIYSETKYNNDFGGTFPTLRKEKKNHFLRKFQIRIKRLHAINN